MDSTRDKGGGAWPLGVPGRDVDDITNGIGRLENYWEKRALRKASRMKRAQLL